MLFLLKRQSIRMVDHRMRSPQIRLHEPPVMSWDVEILCEEPDVLKVCKPASVPEKIKSYPVWGNPVQSFDSSFLNRFVMIQPGVLTGGREISVKRLFFNNKHKAANCYNEVNIVSSVEH